MDLDWRRALPTGCSNLSTDVEFSWHVAGLRMRGIKPIILTALGRTTRVSAETCLLQTTKNPGERPRPRRGLILGPLCGHKIKCSLQGALAEADARYGRKFSSKNRLIVAYACRPSCLAYESVLCSGIHHDIEGLTSPAACEIASCCAGTTHCRPPCRASPIIAFEVLCIGQDGAGGVPGGMSWVDRDTLSVMRVVETPIGHGAPETPARNTSGALNINIKVM